MILIRWSAQGARSSSHNFRAPLGAVTCNERARAAFSIHVVLDSPVITYVGEARFIGSAGNVILAAIPVW